MIKNTYCVVKFNGVGLWGGKCQDTELVAPGELRMEIHGI
jgi:hypothetical protein